MPDLVKPEKSQHFERLELWYDGDLIPFAVIRSGKRKTCSVVIDARGIYIAAPVNQELESIREAIIPKLPTIAKREAEFRAQYGNTPNLRSFISGESLRLLGRPYILRVLQGDELQVELRGTRIYVTAPNAVKVREALEDWYKIEAAKVFAQRVQLWSKRLGVTPGRILVRSQKTRWGSCDSAGNLRLNWRLVMAPMSLIDYVIAHELTHLRAADHSPLFWTHLRSVMPDYLKRKAYLDELGVNYYL